MRQYFPKGTDLSRWNAEDIEAVAAMLNSRPRKTLGWKTPAEAFNEHLLLTQTGRCCFDRLNPVNIRQCCYTERIDEVGAAPSIGTVGDSYDNAMAESVMGIFKTELHRNPAALATNGGPWKGLDDLEIATCAWVSWFNEERLHSELGDRTPEEFEAEYRHKSQPDAA